MLRKMLIVSVLVSCILIYFICSTPVVYAWGPISHCGLISQALEKTSSSSGAYNLIQNHGKWFWIGVMFPDITVLHYYTNLKKYENTHDFMFYQDLWHAANVAQSDEAKAFALGVGTHLIQDAVIHNTYIPFKIRSTHLVNNIIHPLSEGFIEGKFITSTDPWYDINAEAQAKTAFVKGDPGIDSKFSDSVSLSDYTPITWAVKIMGFEDPVTHTPNSDGQSYVDDANAFSDILCGGDFYRRGYVVGGGSVWDMYYWLGGLATSLRLVDVNDVTPYYAQTVNSTVAWYNSNDYEHPSDYVGGLGNSPSGMMSIEAANREQMNIFVSLVIIICTVSGLLIFRSYRKKHKRGGSTVSRPSTGVFGRL